MKALAFLRNIIGAYLLHPAQNPQKRHAARSCCIRSFIDMHFNDARCRASKIRQYNQELLLSAVWHLLYSTPYSTTIVHIQRSKKKYFCVATELYLVYKSMIYHLYVRLYTGTVTEVDMLLWLTSRGSEG